MPTDDERYLTEKPSTIELLTDPAAAPPERIDPDPALAATYRRQRASVPELIGALGTVAGLFETEER